MPLLEQRKCLFFFHSVWHYFTKGAVTTASATLKERGYNRSSNTFCVAEVACISPFVHRSLCPSAACALADTTMAATDNVSAEFLLGLKERTSGRGAVPRIASGYNRSISTIHFPAHAHPCAHPLTIMERRMIQVVRKRMMRRWAIRFSMASPLAMSQ